MSKQKNALDYLITKCCAADPDCGIQLQGSVARGEEHPDSDIDLTIVLSQCEPREYNELITKENHYSMTRVYIDKHDVNVDINWLHAEELVDIVTNMGASDWWMFLRGIPIHDPIGLAEHCQQTISHWFDENPSVASAWKLHQTEVEKHKRNPECELQFSNQPEFCEHLRKIERKTN